MLCNRFSEVFEDQADVLSALKSRQWEGIRKHMCTQPGPGSHVAMRNPPPLGGRDNSEVC